MLKYDNTLNTFCYIIIMSWGATAFTPIVTRNEPPFGFHEVQNPPDFPVCNENPWGTGDRMKAAIQDKLKLNENRKRLNITDQNDHAHGYDIDYDHAQTLRCVEQQQSPMEQFVSGTILNYNFTETIFLTIMTMLLIWYLIRKGYRISF